MRTLRLIAATAAASVLLCGCYAGDTLPAPAPQTAPVPPEAS